MYLLRLGFLDGLPGLQVCMIMSFHNTFFKQGKLWALEYAVPQCDLETAGEEAMPTTIKFPRVARGFRPRVQEFIVVGRSLVTLPLIATATQPSTKCFSGGLVLALEWHTSPKP